MSLLCLNIDKCKVIHIGNTPHSKYDVSNLASPVSTTSLSEVSHEKDFGVWVTNKLESSLHCHKAVVSANKC